MDASFLGFFVGFFEAHPLTLHGGKFLQLDERSGFPKIISSQKRDHGNDHLPAGHNQAHAPGVRFPTSIFNTQPALSTPKFSQ